MTQSFRISRFYGLTLLADGRVTEDRFDDFVETRRGDLQANYASSDYVSPERAREILREFIARPAPPADAYALAWATYRADLGAAVSFLMALDGDIGQPAA